MKRFILSLTAISIWSSVSAQIVSNEYTVYTLNRDTLWIKNDPVGLLIKDSWNSSLNKDLDARPVIIVVEDLAVVRKKYTIQKNKNKKS